MENRLHWRKLMRLATSTRKRLSGPGEKVSFCAGSNVAVQKVLDAFDRMGGIENDGRRRAGRCRHRALGVVRSEMTRRKTTTRRTSATGRMKSDGKGEEEQRGGSGGYDMLCW